MNRRATVQFLALTLLVAGTTCCPTITFPVVIPNIVGMTQGDAEEALANAGITEIPTVESAYSETVEEGIVIRQFPVVWERVGPDTPVLIVVSDGSAKVEVPNVVEMPYTLAQATLTALGLAVAMVQQVSDIVPAGNVISQIPAAATSVSVGSAVAITVAVGHEGILVPDVQGLTEECADAVLDAFGLVMWGDYTYNDAIPAGLVVDQDPLAEANILTGSTVAVSLSLGPETLAVPDVVTLSQADAEAALAAVTLSVTTTQEYSDTVAAGLVISQDPAAGTLVLHHSAVAVVISLGVEQKTVPNVVNMTQAQAEAALAAAGLTLGTVGHAYDASIAEGNVIGQNPAANTSVDHDSPVNIVLSLGTGPLTIYVSDSEGDDVNNHGRSEDSPYKTLAHAITFLRDGSSDSLLLKRGDTWAVGFDRWKKSGISAEAPMLIATYGDPSLPRPIVGPGTTTSSCMSVDSYPVNHLTIRGVQFTVQAFRALGPLTNLRIEYCYAAAGLGSFQGIEGQTYGGPISDIAIYRTTVVDSYSTTSHMQGVFTDNVNGVVIEECFFDHNGWHETIPGAEATVFNHNVYITTHCTNAVVRNNIFSRASSHGLQMRPGGVVENNLFVRNPIGLSFGFVLGGVEPLEGGVTGHVTGNVIIQGTDIGDALRGEGMEIGNVRTDGAVISDNIIANTMSGGPQGIGFFVDGGNGMGVYNTEINDNIVYDWNASLRFESSVFADCTVQNNEFQDVNSPFSDYAWVPVLNMDEALYSGAVLFSGNTYYSQRAADNWFQIAGTRYPFSTWVTLSGEADAVNQIVTYPDPERDLATYQASLGGTATFEAFIEEERKQDEGNWRDEYTAQTVIAYLRAGFGR